jgi:YebC/PmpR family DNA-binding regulatory protein
MSGHSKWATIKRKKGALDAKRGKLFTKLIKEITVAARMGGGNIDGNPRLRKAATDARSQAMPADTIKRAIQRGTGELEGANYEEIVYEGTGPGGTLFMVEAMTDNKNRTVAEIRKIFEKSNGAMGSSGTAGWAFDRKGVVMLAKEAATEDQLMEIAVGAGADDYTDQGEEFVFFNDQWVMRAIADQWMVFKASTEVVARSLFCPVYLGKRSPYEYSVWAMGISVEIRSDEYL